MVGTGSQERGASVERRYALTRELERDLATPVDERHDSVPTVADSSDERSSLANSEAVSVAEIGDEISSLSATVEEIAATPDEVDRGMARVESAMETLQDIAVAEASRDIRDVSAATDDQADRVADEVESVAAANEEQAAKPPAPIHSRERYMSTNSSRSRTQGVFTGLPTGYPSVSETPSTA